MSLEWSEIGRKRRETDLGFESESTAGDGVELVLVDLLLTQRGRGDWDLVYFSQLVRSISKQSASGEAEGLQWAQERLASAASEGGEGGRAGERDYEDVYLACWWLRSLSPCAARPRSSC